MSTSRLEKLSSTGFKGSWSPEARPVRPLFAVKALSEDAKRLTHGISRSVLLSIPETQREWLPRYGTRKFDADAHWNTLSLVKTAILIVQQDRRASQQLFEYMALMVTSVYGVPTTLVGLHKKAAPLPMFCDRDVYLLFRLYDHAYDRLTALRRGVYQHSCDEERVTEWFGVKEDEVLLTTRRNARLYFERILRLVSHRLLGGPDRSQYNRAIFKTASLHAHVMLDFDKLILAVARHLSATFAADSPSIKFIKRQRELVAVSNQDSHSASHSGNQDGAMMRWGFKHLSVTKEAESGLFLVQTMRADASSILMVSDFVIPASRLDEYDIGKEYPQKGALTIKSTGKKAKKRGRKSAVFLRRNVCIDPIRMKKKYVHRSFLLDICGRGNVSKSLSETDCSKKKKNQIIDSLLQC